MSPITTSVLNVNINSDSMRTIDLTRELLITLEEVQAKLQEVRCFIENYTEEEISIKQMLCGHSLHHL
jgi:hypothetical protein